ncbi:MAG TPA: tetratricopeptide repeat protein [Acidobacteriaceae bacterium]|nr:tetratricopeptide repeat protein [Acidobacteriaceae bacterium]
MLSFRHLPPVARASRHAAGTVLCLALALPVLALPLAAQTRAQTPAPACHPPQTLEAKIKAHPDVAGWTALGNYYGERQQYSCAAKALQSALRLSPHSAQLHYLTGLAYYENHQCDEAMPHFRSSVQADPSHLPTHLLFATCLVRANQLPDAEEQWRAALKIDPTSDMALHGLSRALIEQHKYADEIEALHGANLDPPLAVDLAIAYGNAGMLDNAIAVITKAMRTSDDVHLSSNLVALYVKAQRSDEAEKVAQKAYTNHPDDFLAQIDYMRTLVLNGDWTPARPLGQKLLEEKPHDFDVLYTNGVLERQDGQYEAARDHLKEAAQMNQQMPNLFYNLGVALARLHDPAGAIEPLRTAITLGDKDPEVHFELANALRLTGQADEARQEMVTYQQAVRDEQNRTLSASKASEADTNLQKGDLQHAIALYREAVAAFPKDTMVSYKLALALDKAGQTDEERTILQQLIAADPTFAAAQYQLGYLDSRSGDNAAAEQHFRSAVTTAPAYVDAWISLAATLGMESKFSEAQQAVAMALRIDPQNSQAQQLNHELGAAAQKH